MANNITEVRLLNVPLENDYLHTIYFELKADQTAYFKSKTVANRTYNNLSYQRKDKFIRIPAQYDDLLNCNYLMYTNTAYSNKWYYAFITDIEYINDGLSNVHIETDVIQTWMFDYTVKASFVEREHVNSDEIGEHIVDEGLQLSEYVCNAHDVSLYAGNEKSGGYNYLTDSNIIVGVTQIYDDGDMKNVNGFQYNGIYSGIRYFCFENKDGNKGIEGLDAFLQKYADEGAVDSIVCMFLAPKKLAYVRESDGIINHAVIGGNLPDRYGINQYADESDFNHLITFTNDIDGYSPRNKKLLAYPYRYLLVTNNSGGSVTYNYENFYTSADDVKTVNKPSFIIEGCLTPGCSIRMVPLNYKGCSRNDDEGINMGKFPILNWTSDVYTNWLTQNGVNIGLSIVGSVAQMGIGIAGALLSPATGGLSAVAGASAVASGVTSIASTLGEVHKMSMTPPQAEGNINSGDVITSTGRNDFHFYQMSVKKQCAEIIDGFFDMFGYKVNKVKVPNKNHRRRWWYTKTIDVNIDGAIPMNDLRKIKECYNRGITFWKDADGDLDLGNYNKENYIIKITQ
ncbi:MAG: hypothetical protein J6U90_04960 [Methanobrevibacter sp.]|nr:hypothetical protein [Methanobrevibacter sp.]